MDDALRAIGIGDGDVVMVHASMRAVGGRAERVVEALLEAVGPRGTIMAYVDFEPTDTHPNFDREHSPAVREYGALAEIIRTWPGAERSCNPGASMAAIGEKAKWLTANHPLDYGYGPDTPLARLVESNGKVLLLGSDLDHVTLVHHAEHLARIAEKRIVRHTYLIDGEAHTIEEFDTSDGVVATMPEDFIAQVTRAFVDGGHARAGTVGGARAVVLPARPFVEFAVAKIEREFG